MDFVTTPIRWRRIAILAAIALVEINTIVVLNARTSLPYLTSVKSRNQTMAEVTSPVPATVDMLCEECRSAHVGRHFSCVARIKSYMTSDISLREAQTIVCHEHDECSVCDPTTCKLNNSHEHPSIAPLPISSTYDEMWAHVLSLSDGNASRAKSIAIKKPPPHKPQGRSKPYFKDSNVLVFQFGDLDYADRMKNHTKRNKQWTDCMGYDYRLEQPLDPDSTECMYTQKVQAIHNALEAVPNNDWIVFVDLDVQYQAESCDALEMILPKTSVNQSQPCEFISLASPHTINTGVVVIKSTNFTRRLVKRWYKVQLKHKFCSGSADQMALQEVVMEEMEFGSYDEKCKAISHRRYGRNICFKRSMPESERSIRQLCLMSCHEWFTHPRGVTRPLQCRDCSRYQCYEPAAVFRHEKTPLMGLLPPS